MYLKKNLNAPRLIYGIIDSIISSIINSISVEGTTYNHGRPEGISERLAFYEPVSRYATGMSALRTQIYGIFSPRQLLAYIPRPSSVASSVVGTYTA